MQTNTHTHTQTRALSQKREHTDKSSQPRQTGPRPKCKLVYGYPTCVVAGSPACFPIDGDTLYKTIRSSTLLPIVFSSSFSCILRNPRRKQRQEADESTRDLLPSTPPSCRRPSSHRHRRPRRSSSWLTSRPPRGGPWAPPRGGPWWGRRRC